MLFCIYSVILDAQTFNRQISLNMAFVNDTIINPFDD